MKKTRIALVKSEGDRWISTSVARTSMSQRTTLEATMTNLATYLGIREIKKIEGARGWFYKVDTVGYSSYQSASNLIHDLSERLLKQRNIELSSPKNK